MINWDLKSTFRATTPADRSQLSMLLTGAFDDTHPDASLLDPAVMAWKYWSPRADWIDPRSYVLERDGRLIAHAAIWPLTFPGANPIRGVQMLDWCSAKDAPGAGITLLQKLSSMFDFMYSIGGSDMTVKVLPAFGFREATQVWTGARPLRPLRQMLTHQAVNWKLAPRFLRNWAWAKSPLLRGGAGWKTVPLTPGEIPPGFGHRSSAFFDYLLLCPSMKYELHGIADETGFRGYFVIGVLRGQARIAGFWLRNPSEDHWRLAYVLAQRTAAGLQGAYEVVARGSVGVSGQAAAHTGLRIVRQSPVYLLNKKSDFTLLKDFQFQLVDDDSAFLDVGQASYLT
jgi:hypothetical protein